MKNYFGYPSTEPCAVCGEYKNNQSEPRFGYTVCEKHQKIPPAYLKLAKRQFYFSQETIWDNIEENEDGK